MRTGGGSWILALGENEVSSLYLPLGEPLSPELVLVCPELAEKARPLVPEPDSVAAASRAEPAARLGPLQTLVLGLVCVLMTVTPLVLMLLVLSPHAPRHVPRAAEVSRPAQAWP
jgi:hypothetical protein